MLCQPFLIWRLNGKFTDYVGPIDGNSLAPALHGDVSQMNDMVISEFAADGSTGPSRMVKRGSMKYMDLEGIETLLFDLDQDPLELNNLIKDKSYAGERRNCEQSARGIGTAKTCMTSLQPINGAALKFTKPPEANPPT